MTNINLDEKILTKIAEILNKEGLSEIEITEGDKSIRVAKNLVMGSANYVAAPAVAGSTAVSAPVAKPVENLANHPGAVSSPMVGTVYLKPDPNSNVFVNVGDNVTKGQTLLIIEAMKVMNPIKAAKAGKISQILVGDSQPVEFGEVLMVIE